MSQRSKRLENDEPWAESDDELVTNVMEQQGVWKTRRISRSVESIEREERKFVYSLEAQGYIIVAQEFLNVNAETIELRCFVRRH